MIHDCSYNDRIRLIKRDVCICIQDWRLGFAGTFERSEGMKGEESLSF